MKRVFGIVTLVTIIVLHLASSLLNNSSDTQSIEDETIAETVRLEIASEDGEWATGYDKNGKPYKVNEEWVQVGDTIDAMVDKDGEINFINHI